jgi:tetratricopeptide (TPR) repeat protein/TolB-like protein
MTLPVPSTHLSLFRRGLFFLWAASFLLMPTAGANVLGQGALQQDIYLVFPFENAGASPRLDWLSEGLEELSIQYLSAAGQQVYSHTGRMAELERYGLPASAKLSRATMLRVAQDLDADFVVLGSFVSDGKSLTIEARILRVEPSKLSRGVRETGPLDSLMDMQNRVIWRSLTATQPTAQTTLADFSKAQHPPRLDAFELYIRAIRASDDEARIRDLRGASRLEPDWPDPAFELGQTYFARKDCNSALPWFARVPSTHAHYLEANFATAVCRLQMNQPDRAEQVLVAQGWARRGHEGNTSSAADVPEVLNDLAIARARQGKVAEAQSDLKRASQIDPGEDDYPFNLGLLALRAKDFTAAAKYFREAVDRRPDNPDDRALLIEALEKAGKKTEADQQREAAAEALGPDALPAVLAHADADSLHRLERIKTELDVVALRSEMEPPRPRTSSGRATAGVDTAVGHVRRGRQELSAGRLEEAEKEFHIALTMDPASATAHRSLGEISWRRGDLDHAVRELQASLGARDSAVVRTTLGRIYLEQKRSDLARGEVERALKLAPNYSEAQRLLKRLENSRPKEGVR